MTRFAQYIPTNPAQNSPIVVFPVYPQPTLTSRYNTYEDIPRSVRIALARAVRAQHQICPPPSRDDLIEFWGITPEWLDRILQEIPPEESEASTLQFPGKDDSQEG